jgi:hypothetical protein
MGTKPVRSIDETSDTKLTSAAPGSGKGYLIVSDIEAARDALVAVGIEVGEIFQIGPSGCESRPVIHKSTGSSQDCGRGCAEGPNSSGTPDKTARVGSAGAIVL